VAELKRHISCSSWHRKSTFWADLHFGATSVCGSEPYQRSTRIFDPPPEL